ncbi:MAG: hypothetical protein IPN71_07290 [Fibrobacteres bacterium]|nr:hypothetical protein [Fibrobacterota bacterium]
MARTTPAAIDPLSASRALSVMGIRLYTIGLGTSGIFEQDFVLPRRQPSQGKPPIRPRPQGPEAGGQRGRKSFLATDRDARRRRIPEIDRLEKSEISPKTFWETRELFVPWAIAALCLVLAAWALERTWLRRTP